MKEDISVSEYRSLLSSLSSDTPLGYAVGIRAETDREAISKMTAHEKKMRRDWQKFLSQKCKNSPVQYTMTVEEVRQMFKSLAKGGDRK